MIKLLDDMPLDNLTKKLSEKKSSYVYDLTCDYYFYSNPIFVAYQCHFERQIYVLSVIDGKRLVLVDSKNGGYSNVRTLVPNGKDSVAGVGSNGMVSILKCKILEDYK